MTVGWDVDPRVDEWPGLPAPDGDATADACVVGLGGSGLAAVEAFADVGVSVIGIDAGRVAGWAAGRNGGFLLGGGAPSLHDAQQRWGSAVALELYRETLAELDRLTDQLGGDVVLRRGSIRLAGLPGSSVDTAEEADRERERTDCATQAGVLRAAGIAAEDYDGELGTGLFLPDDGQTNPAVRVLGTGRRLAGRARLFEQTRVRSVSAGEVVTERGTVRAAHVVVAVDGRLETLLPQLTGIVRTARLQMLATAAIASGRLPCPVYSRWGYDYAQQDSAGRLYVGGGRDQFAEHEWTTETDPTDEVQGWIDQVATRMAGASVTVDQRWAAPVGFTEDGRALCLPVADGVVACGGYSGTGNLVGPVATRAAVRWLLDGTAPPAYLRSE
ncbi:MAG: NAD(P)/FAD-dependent oxidoreductase [Jatrophihabitans sp.]